MANDVKHSNNTRFQISKRRTSGGLWDTSYPAKLDDLAEWLQAYTPLSIVELGSGLTTCVICDYLKSRSDAACMSVDTLQWSNATAKTIPALDNHKFVEAAVIYSQTTANYQVDLAGMEIDLLYVDGPDVGGRCGIDASIIAATSNVLHVLFDIRHKSVRHFQEAHPNYINVKRASHHTWMKRED